MLGLGSRRGGTNGAALSASLATATFAKTGAKKKRTAPDMLAQILTPEDFGAIGDGTTHTLASLGYATLSAAQVDYPAATALSDEADWCAMRQLIESSGAKWIVATGKYVIPNVTLAQVIRGQSDQRIHLGRQSQWIVNNWGTPSLAWVEKSDFHCEGLHIVQTALFPGTTAANNPFTPANFNSTVGPIWTAGQSYRNIAGLVVLSGTDRCELRGTRIEHATPGFKGCIYMGIAINTHQDLSGSEDIRIIDSIIDDCVFGIFGITGRNCRILGTRCKRYDQVSIDTWAAGHLVYVSTVNGVGNNRLLIEDVYDQGFYNGTDSYTFTCDTTADTITWVNDGEAMAAAMATGAGIIFVNDKPPAPLVRDKTYFVLSWSSPTYQVANTPGGAAIDLTAQAGANCRFSLTMPLFTIHGRYSQDIKISNLKSFRPHGCISNLNSRLGRVEDVAYNCEIWSGTLAAATATGGTFDAGVPAAEGAAVGRQIRITSGAASGYKGEVITQAGGGTQTFTVSPAWAVTPSAGDSYEVGTRFACNGTPIHGASAFNSWTFEDFRWCDIAAKGEFANQSPMAWDTYIVGTAPQAAEMIFEGLRIDVDISRATSAAILSVRGTDIALQARVKTRNAWPAGEKGMINVSQGSTGYADIFLVDPASYSRIVPAANCDFEVRFRAKGGKPIPFTGQWANEATTAGLKVLSHPNEAMYVSGTGGTTTGAGTITISNFGRLKDNGLFYLSALVHDSGWTQVCFVEWLINFAASGTPTVTKLNTRQLVGTSITTADVTQASGVLSATITTSATVTATVAWTLRQLMAH